MLHIIGIVNNNCLTVSGWCRWLFPSSSNHSNLILLHVNSLNTSICSVTRSGELVTWFNVHQSTRAKLRDSLMYNCHTVSGRTLQEGTADTNTSWCGSEIVLNGEWLVVIFYMWVYTFYKYQEVNYSDLPLTRIFCGIVAVLLNGSPFCSTTKTDTMWWPPLTFGRTPSLRSSFPFLLIKWKDTLELLKTATRTPVAGEPGIK